MTTATKTKPATPEKRVRAMSKAHTRYKLEDGTIVPGVTTVINLLAKPALINWANRMGLDGIDTAKYVDSMAEVGTYAHYLILCDLTGEEPETESVSPTVRDLAENAFLSYLAWKSAHDVVPDLVETQLVSESDRYGGTIDFYGTVDGVPTLIDFKTSSGIYPEHSYQLAAYWRLLAYARHRVEQAKILQIGRTEDEGFSEHTFKDPSKRQDLFMHLRAVYDLQKELGGNNRWNPRKKATKANTNGAKS